MKAAKIVSANKVVSLIHPRTGRGLITTASTGFGVGRTGTRIVVLIILVRLGILALLLLPAYF